MTRATTSGHSTRGNGGPNATPPAGGGGEGRRGFRASLLAVTSRVRAIVALATALALFFGAGGIAFADNVKNDVVAGGNDTITLTGATAGSTVVNYHIQPTGGSCDAADGSSARVTVTVPTGVSKSPSAALEFVSCDTLKPVTFTSATLGEHQITVSVADTNGSYSTSPATFKLKVVRPNSAPTVTVTGVTAGASYEKGDVPAANCQVEDAEDGARTFAATLSAVSGTLASYGLGGQTASCSYTDAGGLTRSDSKTYSIVDTTKPQLSLPGDITKEASGPSGEAVTYSPTATDAVDPAPRVTCDPVSGSTFVLGMWPVSCSATDVAGNKAEGVFRVIVQDTTKPVLTLPADIAREATGPGGAAVAYSVSAHDAVDGAIAASCAPISGATFALGSTPVNCSATDRSSNSVAGGFNVAVVDTTEPALTLPVAFTVEATGPTGAVVPYSASASDLVDGATQVHCDRPSNTTFGLGATTVNCTTVDSRNNRANGSFVVTVVDTTKPELNLPGNLVREATKPQGADISYAASASDLVDGVVAVSCFPATGGTFDLGVTTVNCEAADDKGNRATGSFTVTVEDTTPPTMAGVPGDLFLEATSRSGATATFSLPTAADVVDGARLVTCTPSSGSLFALGTPTTVTCSASDTRNNRVEKTFTVTVADTTPPTVTVPGNIVAEATSADGAAVSWTGVAASDVVDGTVAASCDRAPGVFALGTHTVTCSASDAAGNRGHNSFTVVVQDTRAPDVTVPTDMVKEATSPDGATVTWTGVSAEDAVDGKDLKVSCVPPSGSAFGLGDTTVRCSSTDKANNTGTGAFVVTVRDTTAPTLNVPADLTLEATSAAGAPVTYSVSATDLVDTAVAVGCDSLSGSTFPLGSPTTVTCTAEDDFGNRTVKTFKVTVVDTTAPVITVPGSAVLEATGADGGEYNYAASAYDAVDGSVVPQCSPPSGSVFGLGATTVTCSAADDRGNATSRSFTVTVRDTTAPTLAVPDAISIKATSAAGAPVPYVATASDIVDGNVVPSCVPASGSTFKPGTTTVTCNAADKAGNQASAKSFTVTVTFNFSGFLPPVDTNKVLNGMKAGSTVAMKWQVANGTGGFISDLAIVNRTASGIVSCTTGATLDELETYSTGSTVLRYDATANQFIYNWQSPRSAGKCYSVVIALTDGNSYSALFQLR